MRLRNRYRIVKDCYNGYEAQVRYWWLPVWWFQLAGSGRGRGTNTNPTVAEARQVCRRHKYGLFDPPRPKVEVVEVLDDV
mgnify:CR=1 FL=1